jgi:ABC-type lipoprotein release transport system permease subunit
VDIVKSIDTKNLNNLQNKLKDKKMELINEAFAQEKKCYLSIHGWGSKNEFLMENGLQSTFYVFIMFSIFQLWFFVVFLQLEY